MARTYNKPPLIEAVCDFRFSSSQPWDWTIPGLFYERIRDTFPRREQVANIVTTIDPSQGRAVQQSQPKMQFVSEDKIGVIQVGPHNLSVHQLRPYDGWESFKKRILEYLLIYYEAANHAALTRVGLRYVNQVELPSTEIELTKYFNVVPRVPTPIPQAFSSFLFNVEVPYESPKSGLRIIFGTVVPEIKSNLAYVLDLDMFSLENDIPSADHVSDWLETAHSRIEVAFEAAFTDRTRYEIFEEVSK